MSDRRIEILNQRLAAVGETDVAIIDAAELARLRKNSERWEWAWRNPKEFWYTVSQNTVSMKTIALIDAAIAAEKGAGDD